MPTLHHLNNDQHQLFKYLLYLTVHLILLPCRQLMQQ